MSGVTASSLCWLLLCVNLRVSADQIHIRAEPGQTVILPCRAPDSNSPVTAVEWSRPDLEPEHVLLYYEDYSYPENQHPSFKNRVDLQDRKMKDGDASLVLKDVRTEDSGIYECSVIQRGDQKTWKRDTFNTEPIRTINLSVGSAADEGTRSEEGTNNGGNQDGSVDQRNISATPGRQRVLTCRDPQTGNIVAVEWKRKDLSGYVLRYRDEHYDDENQNPSYQNRVHLQDRLMRNRDVSLVLEKVNFTDSGTYECNSQVAGSIERKHICSITLNVSARGGSDGQQRNGYTAAVVLLGSLLVSTGHF